MPQVTVPEAAEVVPKSEKTLYRWIKAGKISSGKNDDGVTVIDVSELARVFPKIKVNENGEIVRSKKMTGREISYERPEHGALQAEVKGLEALIRAKEEVIKQQQGRILDLQGQVGDLRRLLPPPAQPQPQWTKTELFNAPPKQVRAVRPGLLKRLGLALAGKRY